MGGIGSYSWKRAWLSQALILVIPVLCLLGSSCVEYYEPELEESQEVLVISGMISDSPGRHVVRVSNSSPYRSPEFQGLGNCVVNVSDQDGNMVHYMDEGDGVYAADIPDDFLEVGDAVSLFVQTPNSREYRSVYDTILACPEIDSLYWEFQYTGTSDPEKSRPGVQFYIDMEGSETDARNIIWRVYETWEIWASLFGNRIMREFGRVEDFQSRVLYKCWQSKPLDNIITASTRNLSSNSLQAVPLNFVSNETERLHITYSLNVKQQSLTLGAYNYWKRMNEQAAESGGLYEKQPASVPGNIYPVIGEDAGVLGYFYATQIKEKHVYVHNNNYWDFWIPHMDCDYQPLSTLWRSPTINYPVYIYAEGPFLPSWWGPEECFDCRFQGGDTIRPIPWETWSQ